MPMITIREIGWVGKSSTAHFMRSPLSSITACGRVADRTEECLKSTGIHMASCGSCLRILRARCHWCFWEGHVDVPDVQGEH